MVPYQREYSNLLWAVIKHYIQNWQHEVVAPAIAVKRGLDTLRTILDELNNLFQSPLPFRSFLSMRVTDPPLLQLIIPITNTNIAPIQLAITTLKIMSVVLVAAGAV